MFKFLPTKRSPISQPDNPRLEKYNESVDARQKRNNRVLSLTRRYQFFGWLVWRKDKQYTTSERKKKIEKQ